jgi:hypothetical protein
VPTLFSTLIKEGGPLYTNRAKIFETIFSNGDFLNRAREIQTIFAKKIPYWKQLYFFTEARIGDSLANSSSGYPLSEVLGIPVQELLKRHQAAKEQDPHSFTRLESMVRHKSVIDELETGKGNLPFADLKGMYKKLVFREFLHRTIETSRNPEAKQRADARNRTMASEKLVLSAGTYIHGSAVDYLDSVLLNGNLPGEALGEGAATDSYPFHTDFGCLTQEFLSAHTSVDQVFSQSISNNYGAGGIKAKSGQLFYVYNRTPESYEADKIYEVSSDHTLILGGMPATEISAIVLKDAATTLNTVKASVLANGFYVPIYDIQGQMLFSQTEYDFLRSDSNYNIPVEVWDYSLKTGDQLGSNPGAEFSVPTDDGFHRYYVKFADHEGADHVWNEQLADNIYRHLGVLVPNTKIVKIDTTNGHASQLLSPDQSPEAGQLKNGFIFDALLANWDVVRGDNHLTSNGQVYRIDNGGALLFRARGERKDDFDHNVAELESMLGHYSGITPEDISSQLDTLQARFTDESISQLVDTVRLRQANRDYLKKTLAQRRDHILSHYNRL